MFCFHTSLFSIVAIRFLFSNVYYSYTFSNVYYSYTFSNVYYSYTFINVYYSYTFSNVYYSYTFILPDQFEAEPCTWNENTKCCPQEGMRVVNGVCSFPTTSPNPTTTSAAAQDDPLPTNVNVGPLLTHVNVGCETCTRNLNALRSAQPARGEAIMLIVLAFISLSSLIVLLLAWSYLGRLVTRCLRSHR